MVRVVIMWLQCFKWCNYGYYNYELNDISFIKVLFTWGIFELQYCQNSFMMTLNNYKFNVYALKLSYSIDK